MNKMELTSRLSALAPPNAYKIDLEQYPTDIQTVVELLVIADGYGRIKDLRVADFGCGNGIIGIGAALLGARSVNMYDLDGRLAVLSNDNARIAGVTDNCRAYFDDFFDVDMHFDTVLANPPFGIRSKFSMKAFIKKLRKVSDSFFFIEKANFITEQMASQEGLSMRQLLGITLPKIAGFHKKSVKRVPVNVIYKLPDEEPPREAEKPVDENFKEEDYI